MGRSVFKHNTTIQITLELTSITSITAFLNSVRIPKHLALVVR